MIYKQQKNLLSGTGLYSVYTQHNCCVLCLFDYLKSQLQLARFIFRFKNLEIQILIEMQKYFINWKMRVMCCSSIDFYETLKWNRKLIVNQLQLNWGKEVRQHLSNSLNSVPCINFFFGSISFRSTLSQGCNARKVISKVYTSFVLQCTVSGR